MELQQTSNTKSKLSVFLIKMPIHFIKQTDQYRICIWKTTESEAELLQLLQPPKALTAKSISRRIEYLSSRAAAMALGIHPETILHTANGKPIICESKLHISISHTQGFSCVMTGEKPNFGIDIEATSSRALKIRERFLHPDEIKQLKTRQCYNEPSTILQFWCAKEAIFKALSMEGLDLRTDIRIEFNSSALDTIKGTYFKSGLNFQIHAIQEPEFMLTYCFSEESK